MEKKIILVILLFTFVSISSYTFSKNECTGCTNGSCCSHCNTQECRNWNDRVNRCSGSIDSSAINGSTINYLTEQDGHCCFESIESPYNCNNWGIANTVDEWRNRCSDSIDSSAITENTISYLIEQDGHCCFEGGTYEPQCYICEEENSEAKVTCEARRNRGEAVKRDKCKCVCDPSKGCCGVKLNTVVPFIGDCIEMTNGNDTTQGVNQLNAFPYLMKGITKILITAIMIFSIIIVIAAGFLMSTSVASEGNYKKGVELLKNVLICLILLGCSGLILKLVNPNFFG